MRDTPNPPPLKKEVGGLKMSRYKVTVMDDEKGSTVVVKGRVPGGRTAREIRHGVLDADLPKAIREAMQALEAKLATP